MRLRTYSYFFLLLTTWLFFSSPVMASFDCGPHYEKYHVNKVVEDKNRKLRINGIRCVRLTINEQYYENEKEINFFPGMVWYGEEEIEVTYQAGTFGGLVNISYSRHIGEAEGSYPWVFESSGSRIPLVGNGTVANGVAHYNTINLVMNHGDFSRIELSGGVDEVWIKDGTYFGRQYTRPASVQPLTGCGEYFYRYTAKDNPPDTPSLFSKAGENVRCVPLVFRDGILHHLKWFAEGHWNGNNYAHIGYDSYAADLCYEGTDICNLPLDHDITSAQLYITHQLTASYLPPKIINVSGAWEEDFMLTPEW